MSTSHRTDINTEIDNETDSTSAAPPARPGGAALEFNAVFSLATGLLLAVAPTTVGGWLGVNIDGWLRLLGIGLVGHAAALAWVARRPDWRRWTRLNVAMIAPYPALMVGLVAAQIVQTGTGRLLVLADGAIVGALAVAQWRSLRR